MMKKILLLLALSIPLLATNCSKSPPSFTIDIPPLINFDSLPPITTEGKNTFGCRVNGEIWVPNINNQFFGRRIEATYHPPTGNFGVSGSKRLDDKDIHESISIGISGVFDIGETQSISARFTNYTATPCPGFNSSLDTTQYFIINILRLDKEVHIISGTFEFTSISDGCPYVAITDGRFDITY